MDIIKYEDILSLNFYKKEIFNGSFCGMRYRIQKTTDASDDKNDIFEVSAWPGPYIYSATPDEMKTTAVFPFTEEGRRAAVDWLNDNWKMITSDKDKA